MKHLLAVVLGLVAVLGFSACGSDVNSKEQEQIAQMAKNQAQVEQWIKEIEPLLEVQADGTVTLPMMTAASSEAIAFASKAIEQLNASVKSGDLTVGANLSVEPYGFGIYANAQGVTWYWWGVRMALNSTNTQYFLNSLNWSGQVSTVLAAYFGTPLAGLVTGIASATVHWGFSNCAVPGTGIYIYKPYSPSWSIWCSSQPR